MINFSRTLCLILFAAVITACGSDDALHQAAKKGDTAEVKRLIDGGADIDEKIGNEEIGEGFTPLHVAATFGQTEAALVLVKASADIEAKTNEGITPLHVAAQSGHIETVLALIKVGADIEAKTNLGITPLYYAAGQGQTETALALVKAGADIDPQHSYGGVSPLHTAVWHGQTETALALVKAGADIYARTDDGETPLDTAIEKHGKDSDIALALQKAMEKQGGK